MAPRRAGRRLLPLPRSARRERRPRRARRQGRGRGRASTGPGSAGTLILAAETLARFLLGAALALVFLGARLSSRACGLQPPRARRVRCAHARHGGGLLPPPRGARPPCGALHLADAGIGQRAGTGDAFLLVRVRSTTPEPAGRLLPGRAAGATPAAVVAAVLVTAGALSGTVAALRAALGLATGPRWGWPDAPGRLPAAGAPGRPEGAGADGRPAGAAGRAAGGGRTRRSGRSGRGRSGGRGRSAGLVVTVSAGIGATGRRHVSAQARPEPVSQRGSGNRRRSRRGREQQAQRPATSPRRQRRCGSGRGRRQRRPSRKRREPAWARQEEPPRRGRSLRLARRGGGRGAGAAGRGAAGAGAGAAAAAGAAGVFARPNTRRFTFSTTTDFERPWLKLWRTVPAPPGA